MRELIVRKGLPRAFVHSRARRASFGDPNKLLHELPHTNFRMLIENNVMRWSDGDGRVLDEWHGHDSKMAQTWDQSEPPTEDDFEQPTDKDRR